MVYIEQVKQVSSVIYSTLFLVCGPHVWCVQEEMVKTGSSLAGSTYKQKKNKKQNHCINQLRQKMIWKCVLFDCRATVENYGWGWKRDNNTVSEFWHLRNFIAGAHPSSQSNFYFEGNSLWFQFVSHVWHFLWEYLASRHVPCKPQATVAICWPTKEVFANWSVDTNFFSLGEARAEVD